MSRLLAIAAMLVVFGACASEKRGLGDAPVEPVGKQNDAPAHIITMPNGFANIAFKCDDGNGIYSTTRDAAPVIVVDDPNCGDK